jgi:hypothetical protein
MSNFDSNITSIFGEGMSRRECLLKCSNALKDYNSLMNIAGKNAFIDCTLYLLAKDNEEQLRRLNFCFSVDELLDELKHVQKHSNLEQLAENLHDDVNRTRKHNSVKYLVERLCKENARV